MRTVASHIVLTLAAISTAQCGPTSIAPTATATTVQINLLGNVSNVVVGPIDAAKVTVTDGPSAGASTLTGADGSFRLTYNAAAAGHLQVTKDGYAPTVVPVPAGYRNNSLLLIALHVATPPVSLGGFFTATFVADAACGQIPEALRTRQYDAVIDQPPPFPQDTQFAVQLSGASFAQGTLNVPLNSFSGSIEGASAKLNIANAFEAIEIDEGIAEQIAPGVRLEIFGHADLTVGDPNVLSTAMAGYFAVTDASGIHKCDSATHRVTLKRRL